MLFTTHAVFVPSGNSDAAFADCVTMMGPESHSHGMDNHFIAHNRTGISPLFSLEDPTEEYIKCYALLRSEPPVLRKASIDYSVNKC